MKNRFLLLIAIGIFSTSLLNAQDWTPGIYMKQAVHNVKAKTELAVTIGNYGFSGGFCFLGAYVLAGKSVKWNTPLPKGKQLLFIGGGDDDATDVDIKIYDSNGKLVAEDADADNSPIVRYRTNSSENFTIELRLYSTTTSGSFCCISFLEENAPALPISNLEDAIENIIDYGEKANARYDLRFHDLENQWCLYGANQASGTSNSITNISLGSEDQMFLAAGCSHIVDADLFLQDASGNVLTKDEEDDAVPMFRYTTNSSTRYQLRIKNVKSNGNALMMCIVLTE